MPQVAASILAADLAHLAAECEKLDGPAPPLIHFDVMDGVFVPNISFGLPVLQSLHAALPHMEYDVHLMITSPLFYVSHFAAAGAGRITVHAEAAGDIHETFAAIRAAGCKAGVSLRPGTPVEEVFPLLAEVDQVLVMSVEPGFGGQAFLPNAPARIARLRGEIDRRALPVQIEVDGGITADTAPLCVQAGADILVAGSAIFGAKDPAAAALALAQSGAG